MAAFAAAEIDDFNVSADGQDSEEPILVTLLAIATFLLCLHLLNMLIGMMGEI
jgi:hypothetical protein